MLSKSAFLVFGMGGRFAIGTEVRSTIRRVASSLARRQVAETYNSNSGDWETSRRGMPRIIFCGVSWPLGSAQCADVSMQGGRVTVVSPTRNGVALGLSVLGVLVESAVARDARGSDMAQLPAAVSA